MFSLLSKLHNRSIWLERSLLILMGAIYPLGFAPIDIWPLTLLSLGLLFNEIIAKAESDKSLGRAEQSKAGQIILPTARSSYFAIIFYWCIGAFGVGVSWVYVSIHEFGHVPVIGAIGISFLLVLTLSVIKGFAGSLINRFNGYLTPIHLTLFLPLIWVIFEFIQTFIFSGFPWLLAGYSQLQGPLAKLSTWLGVYGVSWFIVAITVSCVILLRVRAQSELESSKNPTSKLTLTVQLAIVIGLFISFPLLAYFSQAEKIVADKQTIDVALVQPNIPQEQKWDRQYFSKVINILFEQSEKHWDADLIVWPEGAIPAYRHQVRDIMAELDQQSRQQQTDLLLGLPIYKPEIQVSYSALISLGQHKQDYHKQVLVPFGEYVPLGNYLRGVIQFLNLPMSSFSPAEANQLPFEFENYQVIPAICYEIAYPNIVHRLAKSADQATQKAKLLVTVSNDAWFGDSLGPYQHMQMAQMRALELGMPLVRSTNDGITAVVNARGEFLSKLDRYQQATLRVQVPLDNYLTLYRQYGLIGVYLLLMVNLLALLTIYLVRK